MAIERSNPLPPNVRYWVDVAPDDQPGFTAWLTRNRGAVGVVSSNRDGDSGWEWVLFETLAPLVWWEGPGYPTIAPPGALTETDVKTVPMPEAPDPRELIRTAAFTVGAIVLAAVALNRVLR